MTPELKTSLTTFTWVSTVAFMVMAVMVAVWRKVVKSAIKSEG